MSSYLNYFELSFVKDYPILQGNAGDVWSYGHRVSSGIEG